jgi:hypothetical protein
MTQDATAGNILSSQIVKLNALDVASVSGTSPIYSDAVMVPKTGKSLVFEVLWSGSLSGTIGLQVAGRGPWQDVPTAYMYGVNSPAGATYAGDVEATDLSAQAIGCSLIDLDVGCSKIRVKYTNATGTGEMRVFVRARVSG